MGCMNAIIPKSVLDLNNWHLHALNRQDIEKKKELTGEVSTNNHGKTEKNKVYIYFETVQEKRKCDRFRYPETTTN